MCRRWIPRQRSAARGLLVAGLVCLLTTVVANGAPAYPIKISANGRYLVDQSDVPFFINGDTAWSLIAQVSREDAELYLQDCAARRINSVIVTLVESHYADNAPANFYGVQPYTTPSRFTTPNEAYFAHADWVINKAAQLGIQIVLAPNYLGCCDDGWYDELVSQNSDADARWFGEWVGNRYRTFPNLVYVWGNDLNPGAARTRIRAMAEGVKATDPTKLQTYHGAPENSALDQWSLSETWLDINVTYTYEPVQGKSLQDFNRSPFVPFFLFESHYEYDWGGRPPLRTRQEAYTAVLSGANGHHYGNNPIWHMNGKPGDNTNTWKAHLNDEGRADLTHVRALFESRPWHLLIPDQNHAVVTSGFGSGENYVAASMTSDGTTAIAYFPGQFAVTVDMSRVVGADAKAWWFNPRDGSSQLAGTFPSSGSRSFTPPTTLDWVLVLDDAARNLPAPGSASNLPAPPQNLRAE